MRIGIAGLGKMGSAMALRLRDQGADLAVWNRSRDKADAFAADAGGCPVADTPAALAAQVDVLITMLFDGDALEAVYRGPGGVLETTLAGKLMIDMSTVRPHTQQALAEAVQEKGGGYVDCPVGGTIGPARQGTLLGMAGGSAVDVARAMPVLDMLCRKVEHVGPVGAGASVKLAVNLPLLVFWQSFGEAMALVAHLKLDPAWLVEFFSGTSGAAPVLKARGPAITNALAGREPGAMTFDVDSIRKDLRTMVAEAGSRGFTVPVAAEALASFDAASAEGLGHKDCSIMPARWAAKADHT